MHINLDSAIATEESGKERSLTKKEKAEVQARIAKVRKYKNEKIKQHGAGYRKLLQRGPLYYRFNDKNVIITKYEFEE